MIFLPDAVEVRAMYPCFLLPFLLLFLVIRSDIIKVYDIKTEAVSQVERFFLDCNKYMDFSIINDVVIHQNPAIKPAITSVR